METTTSRTETRTLEDVKIDSDTAIALATHGGTKGEAAMDRVSDLIDEAHALGAREALTVAASGLAEILVAVEIVRERLAARDANGPTVESLGHIREAVEALRASTQAAAEGGR